MFSLLVIPLEYEDTCDWVCVSFHTLTVKLWLTVMNLRISGIIHFSGKTEFLVPVFGASGLLCHRVFGAKYLGVELSLECGTFILMENKELMPCGCREWDEEKDCSAFTMFLCFGTKTGDLERICAVLSEKWD